MTTLICWMHDIEDDEAGMECHCRDTSEGHAVGLLAPVVAQ